MYRWSDGLETGCTAGLMDWRRDVPLVLCTVFISRSVSNPNELVPAHVPYIHLFPANLGDSACISEIVQAISAVRQFGGRSGIIRQTQCRNWLHFYRIACRMSKIGRKKVYINQLPLERKLPCPPLPHPVTASSSSLKVTADSGADLGLASGTTQ